jgi:uncharacterized protein YfiM (DUF2279 family)
MRDRLRRSAAFPLHGCLNNPYPRTPAMAAGVADHVWSLMEIASLAGLVDKRWKVISLAVTVPLGAATWLLIAVYAAKWPAWSAALFALAGAVTALFVNMLAWVVRRRYWPQDPN